MHRKNGQKKQFENENRYPHNPEEGYPPNKSPRHRMEASRHRGGPPHQGPPGPSGPPPKFPFFAPPPPGMEHPRPPHKPPFPFKRDVIKRIQDLFLLIIIEGQGKQGVTAYQLEKQYKYPRTSATRSLESLEGQLILESIEKTEDGRNQKIYLLTDKGKEELDDMKRNWAGRIAMWTEMIPPEKFGHPLKEPIFKGKDRKSV